MIKFFSSALAVGALCAGAALAQSAPAPQQQQDGGRHHQWMEAHKGDMAQFHARMCNDRYAHHVGMVAELGARLDLTDSQRPLFERWKTVALDSANSRKGACLSHQIGQMDHRPSLPEREAHMREMLKDRLAALDAQAPAMDALYASLTPQQKMELDRMGHRGMGGMHGRIGGHMDGMHRGMGMHGGPHPGGPDGEDQGI